MFLFNFILILVQEVNYEIYMNNWKLKNRLFSRCYPWETNKWKKIIDRKWCFLGHHSRLIFYSFKLDLGDEFSEETVKEPAKVRINKFSLFKYRLLHHNLHFFPSSFFFNPQKKILKLKILTWLPNTTICGNWIASEPTVLKTSCNLFTTGINASIIIWKF